MPIKLLIFIIIAFWPISQMLNAEGITFQFNPPDGITGTELETLKETITYYAGEKSEETKSKTEFDILRTESGFCITYDLIYSYHYMNGKLDNSMEDDIFTNIPLIYIIRKDGRLDTIIGFKNILDSISRRNNNVSSQIVSTFYNYESYYQELKWNWVFSIEEFLGKCISIGTVWHKIDTVDYGNRIEIINREIRFKDMVKCNDIECINIEYSYSIISDGSINAYEDAFFKMSGFPDERRNDYKLKAIRIEGTGNRLIDPKTMLIYNESEFRIEYYDIGLFGNIDLTIKRQENYKKQFRYSLDN